jgi:hypothetical protein
LRRQAELADKKAAAVAAVAEAVEVQRREKAERRAMAEVRAMYGGDGGADQGWWGRGTVEDEEKGEGEGDRDDDDDDEDDDYQYGDTDGDDKYQSFRNRRRRLRRCDLCGEELRPQLMKAHVRSECTMRLVYCPNHNLGCRAEIPIGALQRHLKEGCTVEKQKDAILERSQYR